MILISSQGRGAKLAGVIIEKHLEENGLKPRLVVINSSDSETTLLIVKSDDMYAMDMCDHFVREVSERFGDAAFYLVSPVGEDVCSGSNGIRISCFQYGQLLDEVNTESRKLLEKTMDRSSLSEVPFLIASFFHQACETEYQRIMAERLLPDSWLHRGRTPLGCC